MNNPDSNLRTKVVNRTVTATGFRVTSFMESGRWIEEYEPVEVREKEEPSSSFESDASINRSQQESFDSVSSNGNPPCVEKDPFFDCSQHPDWYLVGKTTVNAVSTTEGINKLLDNEIVYFTFTSPGASCFSTKRCGEIGQLPMDWTEWVIPLVCTNDVNVVGRCIVSPVSLSIMQEVVLLVSFYIHGSVFTSGDNSSWMFDLFRHLKIKPYQKADCAPEELDYGKRVIDIEDDDSEVVAALPSAKRRKGFQGLEKNEQAISVSSLNKIVGAEDTYDLEEMEPPYTLTSQLGPYQKQALYWMTEREKGIDAEKAAQTLHPFYSEYRICDERASSIYVNVFSGEPTVHFPSASQMTRGGILADAMGLGKTVITTALILSRLGKGNPDNEKPDSRKADDSRTVDRTEGAYGNAPLRAKGGTLIICPMSLLSQWKDELETHSRPECLSIVVHYGGERTYDPRVIAKYDVVLTTYGVLAFANSRYAENSIYNQVDWYRVVLDEAHSVKCSKSQRSLASFALSAHCRWCLTGTPLQNNLEDLYGLFCFLHVEPWCNWAWWKSNIQGAYENGNPTGLKWIKAILRLLMLRRTKETKDKEGRPILVLPPTDIQTIECEPSEAERDFYDVLFKRSKVQFDEFVAKGRVLHNYASIFELLLRLRQCCGHPFLVMRRADPLQYWDLNILARRFLETHPDSVTPNQNAPTKAYKEEVVYGMGRRDCLICWKSAYDPVFTPCAHRMCRECLLSSLQKPTMGSCPACRKPLKITELTTCPTEIDVESEWKDSSKISKLLECLEHIRRSGSGEKSIVFSQWTSFLDLLEIPLRKRGIEFLRFDGKLLQKQRERVLKEFNDTGEKMVLLMSLRAGGLGLNLTAASNVFLMDPWWNPAVEEQAIMRIHRIGQKRAVTVRRFIVKETVEERMQQVQARKERMIAGALTDEELKSTRIEELKMLFS